MTYMSIKTIRGRRYRYQQHSYRDNTGRVRTETKYLGPVDGFVRRQSGTREDRALAVAERQAERVDAYQREHFGGTARELRDREQQAKEKELHAKFGLTVGLPGASPVEKSVASPFAPEAPSSAQSESSSQSASEPGASSNEHDAASGSFAST